MWKRMALMVSALMILACSTAQGHDPYEDAALRNSDALIFHPVASVASATPASPSSSVASSPKPASTPKATPLPTSTTSTTRTSIVRTLRGEASWGYGFKGHVVTRYPRGTIIRVCGPIGCTGKVKSWGYGPAKYTGRIADLDVHVFEAVCGPRSAGICRITLTVYR